MPKHHPCTLILVAFFLAALGVSPAVFANSIWITSPAIQCATAPDDTVRVDVMLENNLEPIDDGTLYVGPWDYLYPLVGVERGDLIAGWTNFNGYQPALGGGVVIEVSNDTPIPPGTSGQLVRLKFLTNCCSDGGGLLESPHATKLGLDGSGDFGPPMVAVPGMVLCASAMPGLLAVETGFTTCDGLQETTRVRVMLVDTTVPVYSAGLNLSWDTSMLPYLTYERGELTENWDTFDVIAGSIDGANSEPIPVGTTGTLVTLILQSSCCTNGQPIGYGAVPVHFVPHLLRGDLTSFTVQYGEWRCAPVATRQSTWGRVKSMYR